MMLIVMSLKQLQVMMVTLIPFSVTLHLMDLIGLLVLIITIIITQT